MKRNLKNNEFAISTMVIAAVLVVVVVAGAVVAYAVLTQNPPLSPSSSPTPTPVVTVEPTSSVEPTASVQPTPSASSPALSPTPSEPSETVAPSTPPNVAAASTLKYSVSLTENAVLQGSYTFYGKNLGTGNVMMRIDFSEGGSTDIQSYIFNGAEQKAWSYSDGEWTDISEVYSVQFGLWNNLWQSYVGALSTGWTGTEDYSYTAAGATVRIYNISVNSALADSIFTPN